MSVLESPAVRSSAFGLDVLEDAFLARAHDPAKPDVVDLGRHVQISMVELSRGLVRLDADLRPDTGELSFRADDSRGHLDLPVHPPLR